MTEECVTCGFNDEDCGCNCPHYDKWYSCPIENKKPENVKTIKEYAEWVSKMRCENEQQNNRSN